MHKYCCGGVSKLVLSIINTYLIVKLIRFCAMGSRGCVGCRGVIYMVNIHTFWCRGVSTIINFGAMGCSNC